MVIYRFENYELDTEAYSLVREGGIIEVEPLVLEVLTYLIEHRDRVIGKEELIEKVWPASFVSDSSLSRTIHLVRRVLGDDGTQRRLIGTVYGRGYRFLSSVEEVSGPSPDASPAPIREGRLPPPTDVRELPTPDGEEKSGTASWWPRGRRRKRLWIELSVVALAIVLIRLAQVTPIIGPLRFLIPPTIAVVPFANLGDGDDGDFFSLSMNEAVLQRLAEVTDFTLRTLPRGERAPRSGWDLREIGERLDANLLVEGSYHRTAEGLVVSWRVIDVSKDSIQRADTIELPQDALREALEQVADAVAAEVAGRPVEGERSALAGQQDGEIDPVAFEDYLRARYLLEEEGTDPIE